MDDRLIDLETRLAFQENLLQTLNETVAAQQRTLDDLTEELRAVRQQMRAMAPSLIASPDEEAPPPHY